MSLFIACSPWTAVGIGTDHVTIARRERGATVVASILGRTQEHGNERLVLDRVVHDYGESVKCSLSVYGAMASVLERRATDGDPTISVDCDSNRQADTSI